MLIEKFVSILTFPLVTNISSFQYRTRRQQQQQHSRSSSTSPTSSFVFALILFITVGGSWTFSLFIGGASASPNDEAALIFAYLAAVLNSFQGEEWENFGYESFEDSKIPLKFF